MEDNTHVGLFGNNGAGWKFGMNTQTGALKVNGTEGQLNQVLVSGGSSSSSSWVTAGSLIKTFYANGFTLGIDVTDDINWVDIPINQPSNTMTINVPVKSRLIISGHFRTWGPFCPLGCGDGGAEIALQIDEVGPANDRYAEGITTITAGANSMGSAAIVNYFYDVAAGNHTIKFRVKRSYWGANNNLENFTCKQVTVIDLPID